ncbi:hypothetical protein HPG69_011239, partial [Diceros bicornis minor]
MAEIPATRELLMAWAHQFNNQIHKINEVYYSRPKSASSGPRKWGPQSSSRQRLHNLRDLLYINFTKKKVKELNSLNHDERLPFIFLKEQVGSYSTLESSANHGYFVYASNVPRQPVGVTKHIGKEENTQFEFENID